jgi:hypothetical protein
MQSRNISQQTLTIGLDLGDRSICYCVLDESGRIVMEQKVSTTAKMASREGHDFKCDLPLAVNGGPVGEFGYTYIPRANTTLAYTGRRSC